MNTNFVWHSDTSKHLFYVPADQAEQVNDKNLDKDFDKKVTSDGREIYILKSNPLPNSIKPAFENVSERSLQSLGYKISTQAGRDGDLNYLIKALANGVPIHPDDCAKAAANNGHIHILEWLQNNNMPLHPFIDEIPYLEGDYPEVIQWAISKEYNLDPTLIASEALKNNKEKTIKWYVDSGMSYYFPRSEKLK